MTDFKPIFLGIKLDTYVLYNLYFALLESLFLYFPSSEDSDDEEAEEDMNVDESKENEDDEIAHALAAADALGKATQVSSVGTDDITDGLKELDMDNYDDEDDGNLSPLANMLIWVEHSFFSSFFISNVLAVFFMFSSF